MGWTDQTISWEGKGAQCSQMGCPADPVIEAVRRVRHYLGKEILCSLILGTGARASDSYRSAAEGPPFIFLPGFEILKLACCKMLTVPEIYNLWNLSQLVDWAVYCTSQALPRVTFMNELTYFNWKFSQTKLSSSWSLCCVNFKCD